MVVTISNRNSRLQLDVKSVSIEKSVDLLFPSESSSYFAFQKLRGMGIQCYHGGENAPTGPIVMCYNLRDYKFNVN